MKLYLNATSPYARVVRIALLEKQLEDICTLVWVEPWASPDVLLAVNPGAKVPVLEISPHLAVSETLLILDYLEAHYPAIALYPDRAQTLHWLGLGQGLIDAAFATVISLKHETESASSLLSQRRLQAIERLLAALDQDLPAPADHSITISQIMVAVALDYLAFRLPDIQWQPQYPALAQWYHEILARESFCQTTFS